MTSRSRVSVTVFTYNHSKFIVEALESVLAQRTSFDFDVLVLDDCSTDGTTEIVLDYARRYPRRIRAAIPDRNRNDSSWFAELTAAARTDYVALLDADDCWTDPRKLQLQVDFLDSHPECALCFHNVEVWSEARGASLGTFNPPDQPQFSTLDDLLAASFIHTCSAMVRRETIVPLPDWYKRLQIGDWPLFLLAMRHGTAGYIGQVMGRYRQHPEGVWSGLPYIQKLEYLVSLYDLFLGQLGEAHDERIRLLLTSRCHQLGAERSRGPGPVAASPAPVAEIEARIQASEKKTTLRVAGNLMEWNPAEFSGASIDLPRSGANIDSRCFTLAGWALGKDEPAVAVELEQDGRLLERVKVGALRPDVAESFPGISGAERCGFLTDVGVGNRASALVLHAVTKSGRRLRIGELRLVADDAEERRGAAASRE